MKSPACRRCGDTIQHAGGDRFQVRAWDFSTSSVAFVDGRLCADCWDALNSFLCGAGVDDD